MTGMQCDWLTSLDAQIKTLIIALIAHQAPLLLFKRSSCRRHRFLCNFKHVAGVQKVVFITATMLLLLHQRHARFFCRLA